MVRGTISPCLCHPYPRVAGLSAQRAYGPQFLPWRRANEWVPSFSSCVGCCRGGSLFSCPTQNATWSAGWGEESLKHSSQGLEFIRGTLITTFHWSVISIKKSAHKLLEIPHLWTPQPTHRHPQHSAHSFFLHNPIPHPHGWILTHSLVDGESKPLLGIKEQKARLTLQD